MPEIFPLTLLPVKGWREPEDWQNLEERGRGARTQIVETLDAPVWAAAGNFELSAAATAIFRRFWLARRNAGEAFYFFSALARLPRLSLACGAGDGTIKTFRAPIAYPFVDEIAPIAYVAGTAKVYGTDWLLGVENRLIESEDLSDTSAWVARSGATVTRTAGSTDPLGGATAWRIQTSGGSSVDKMSQTVGAATSGMMVRTSVWIKNLSASKILRVSDGLGSNVYVPISSEWTECTMLTVSAGAASSLMFRAPASADALDFAVWHPWVARTDTILGTPDASWSYVPTDAAIIASDASGQWAVVFFPGVAAPSAGQLITLDAQGRQRFLVRFVPGMQLDPEPYTFKRFRIPTQLQEAVS